MNKEAVQHERGPRNSTLKRQIAILNGFRNNSETIKDTPCNSLKKPMFLFENEETLKNETKNNDNLFTNAFQSNLKQNQDLLAAFKLASSIKSNNFLQNCENMFNDKRTQNSLLFNGLVSFFLSFFKI